MSKFEMLGVGQRIRELRQEKGLTLEGLAEAVSAVRKEAVHFTTIAKMERAQRATSLEWVWDLAAALGVSPSDILPLPRTRAVRMVPLLGKIAAGNWQEAVEDASETIPVPEGEGGTNIFALRPEGSSMNLAVMDGSFVIVDPDQRDLLDGKLYAMMNGEGETTFKRFRADPMRLEPMSDDPEHKTIPLGREPFTVIGRVIMEMRQH